MTSITKSIDLLFLFYTVLLVARLVSSWFPSWNHTRPMLFVAHYTDPYLGLFRRLIPPLGVLDVSPFFAFMALRFFQWLLDFFLP